MFLQFIRLEWKAFFRASSFTGNMVLKIFMIIGALYFIGIFLALGIFAYDIIQDYTSDPLVWVCKYSLYYLLGDLTMRQIMQKIPIINIRPLLPLPIKRSTVVNFALGKTFVSFFNVIHAFFFIPFSIVMVTKGYDGLNVFLWFISMWALIYCNNLLNILLTSKDSLFIVFLAVLATFVGLEYYSLFDVTLYTGPVFHMLYTTVYLFIVPFALLAGLWIASHKYFIKSMYLDTGLKGKHEEARTQNFTWLNRFGLMGTFLKNDLKLITRNKRSKSVIYVSIMFLFYGLLFMTGGIEIYDNSYMKMFAAIFVTGGFMFTFGQFVPSWDSAYYPLMMSQNIRYRDYIASKWWLVVVAVAISAVLASFYLYFGVETYLIILSGAVYNIGMNSHLVLLGGAFVKTPIDLGSAKQAFGDKKAFNVQGLLLTLPKLVLPMVLFVCGNLIGPAYGYVFVAAAGVLGFAFRNYMFTVIERLYKSQKYSTIAAYKQKN
ncbi:MAG: hypothetical protein EOP54_16745 [Sphingobacteriales bacterium]|nr:MAG: hypothetical protein EOP54_16745 [Sphingobacteriales bacterium]